MPRRHDDPRTYRYNALNQITHVNDLRVEKLVASNFHVIVTQGPDWDRSGFADQDAMKFGVVAVPNLATLREWCTVWLSSRGADGWTPWSSVAVMRGAKPADTLFYKLGDRTGSLQSLGGAHDVATLPTGRVSLRTSRGRQQRALAKLTINFNTKNVALRTSRAKVLRQLVVSERKNRTAFNRTMLRFRKLAHELASDLDITHEEVEHWLAEAKRGFLQDRRGLMRRAR